MKYLFLGGNSIKNREWIKKLADEFNNPKIILEYLHWEKENENISFEAELKRLEKLGTGKYTIVAKSAGCVLALEAIERNIIDVEKCFLIGVSFHLLKRVGDGEYNNILLESKIPITFIQKLNDPHIGYEELKKIMGNINSNNKCVLYDKSPEADNNHYYADTKYLKDLIL